MNQPTQTTDCTEPIQPTRPLPFLALGKKELKQYPIIQDIAGHSLRIDEQGIMYGSRKSISPPPTREAVDFAKTLLERASTIATPTINSYSLKGQFERLEGCGWIPNGALIVAASELGIRQLWIVDSPNTRIALSRRWFREYLAGPSL